MFRQILVPTDLTVDDPAVKMAADLAGQSGAHVTLLHVIETLRDTPYEELKDFYSRIEKNAKEKLDLLESDLSSKQIQCRKEVIFGVRAAEIVKTAEAGEFDLLIMRSHKIDRQNPSEGWGSISHKVAILSDCAVLLVK